MLVGTERYLKQEWCVRICRKLKSVKSK